MTAMNSLGYFSEPTYITIGDPYASTEGASACPQLRAHCRPPAVPDPSTQRSGEACRLRSLRIADVKSRLARYAGKSGGKTEKLSRYYGKQFGFAPPKKGQVRHHQPTPRHAAANCLTHWTFAARTDREGLLLRRLQAALRGASAHPFLTPRRCRCFGQLLTASFWCCRSLQGEKYVNPGKVETQAQLANNAGKIGGDWKPNNPPKKK